VPPEVKIYRTKSNKRYWFVGEERGGEERKAGFYVVSIMRCLACDVPSGGMDLGLMMMMTSCVVRREGAMFSRDDLLPVL